MSGMTMGQAPATDPHAGHDMSSMPGMNPAPAASAGDHATHDMPGMSGMQMAPGQTMQHDMSSMPGMAAAPTGTDLKPGNKPAPAPAPDHLADRFWGAKAMADSRKDDLISEHGGMTYYQVLFNLAEYQARKGRDGYRWDGEAWIGGDINRLTLKSEGEGSFGKPLEQAEVQALYSHALDPYWNLQAGVRYDFKPNPSRTYATVGIEGLAPYWFQVEGALFLSDKGDVLARAEGYYDQRITNYFVLQPRVEANFSAQDIPETGTGSGLTDLEAGLRLRYEGRREFAPYIGVSWERQFGDTARFTRARGDSTGGFSFVAGVRTWF
jgi:copper resistance protein B